MSRKQSKFLLASIVIVLAISYLIFVGINKTAVYYLTVSEIMNQGKDIYNEGVRVQGKVLTGSIKRDPINLKLYFKITDNNKDMAVYYEGTVPDLYADGREVVVEGVFSPDKVFHATTLLTSCPSKYEAEIPKAS